MILYTEYLKLLEPCNFEKIKIKNLKNNSFYFGDCRNADLALWKNNKFYYIREKFGFKDIEKINHIDNEINSMHDCFIPFEEVCEIPDNILKEFEDL